MAVKHSPPEILSQLLLLLLLAPLLPLPVQAALPPRPQTQDPLNSLARLLGVQKVPAHLRAGASAPLFLRRLFDSVSEADGRAVRAVPYHSDSVVAYADWAPSSQAFYTYNLTRLPYQSNIRYADLHLFRAPSIASGRRSRRRREAVAPSRIVKVKLYQVTDPRRRGTPYGNILLSQKLLPLDYRGWVVFEVSQAALSWMESSGGTNHGLAVFAYYANGDPVPPSRLGFVQRGENRDILQPALMVYASESGNRRGRPELENNSFNRAFDSFDPNRYASVYGGSFVLTASRRLSRSRRAAAAASAAATESASSGSSPVAATARQQTVSVTCRRYPMYVDFAKVGWDEWIIGPPGFNAFFCSGHCPFPLGQQFHPSNHAVVQSIMNHLGPEISGPVQKPSCVPSKLDSISMLYYDDNDRVVLKQYDDMIALACGCQ